MSTQFNFQNIDWNSISSQVDFSKEDLQRVGKFLVRRMTSRVMRQLTATGRPLDQNSVRWLSQKLREGKPTLPLQYTGGIRNPSFYEVEILPGNIMRIQMIPSYRNIHLDLVDISEETGKNYRDWFGIGAEDVPLVVDIITETIMARLQELFS
jgi:hypothetical protein